MTTETLQRRPQAEVQGWQTHVAPAMPMEEQYHLPGGISGTMKELLEDPSVTTRSLRSAQAVMRSLYTVIGADETSRGRIEQREVRTRMGLVLDIFKPKDTTALSANEVRAEGEKNAKRLIETAAVIYQRGRSDLGPIIIK